MAVLNEKQGSIVAHCPGCSRRGGARLNGRIDVAVRTLTERTTVAIDSVAARLPTEFPQQVADTFFAGVAFSSRRLGEMPKA